MKNLFQPWKKSLMARMVGTFFLLVLLTISLVSYLAYLQATRSLTQSVFDRLQAVSILKEDDLNRWVDQQRLDLVFLAWQAEARKQSGQLLSRPAGSAEVQAARSSLFDYLQFVVTSVSGFDELFILDLQGRVALSTLAAREGSSYAQSAFFIQGLSTTYVQAFYTSPITQRPTITVSTPLFDQDKRRVGVLAGHLNLARVDRVIFERTGLGASGETYLINPNHEFVSAAQTGGTQPNHDNLNSEGITNALQGHDGAALYTNYLGVPVVGAYNWLDEQRAALIVEISQAEAFEPARQLAFNIAGFGLLAALILAGVAYGLARQIARPILALTATARRVAAGDLNQTVPVVTQDEVGILAETFNQMTGQLSLLYQNLENKVAERTAELVEVNRRLEAEIVIREQVQERLRSQKQYLEALHDTSLGLISRLELQELFEDLVTRAGQLMNTPHGFIYIGEPGEAEIECKVGVGIFNRLVGYRLVRGEGLAGTIWQTGSALIVNDYDAWPSRVKSFELGLIHSIVGFPLTSGNQVVGTIGLAYDKHGSPPQEFGDYEVELLGRFAHLASIALDNARLYTAAKEARAAAEAANEAKSAFLANVSHELRTPLTSILGFAFLLRKRFQDVIVPHVPGADLKAQRAVNQINENLNIILTEGARLTDLINNLLDLEKIQAGKMTWHMTRLQLPEVIRQAGAATASLFENKGLTWAVEVPAELPEVFGDHDRLEQVVINLISNAVKFSERGQITCRAWLEDQAVLVSIHDQGIGIARADQALVFEKFKQVGDTLTSKPKGTGLGLPICREIITHHGGRIWVESEPGQGSTFIFSLPVDGPEPTHPGAA